MQHALGDGHLTFRIPDRDIRVGADGDRALARIETINLRRISRGNGHEGVEVDATLAHAFGKKQRQARLDARNPRRYVTEMRMRAVDAFAGRSFEKERAVVRGHDLKRSPPDPLPEGVLVRLFARRRGTKVLCALPAGLRDHI